MSDTPKHGGAAFPSVLDKNSIAHAHGMTLLDWFAGQAMSALITDRHYLEECREEGSDWNRNIAEAAYQIADAMLSERDTYND